MKDVIAEIKATILPEITKQIEAITKQCHDTSVLSLERITGIQEH
jgi:hypothetical protein